MRHDDTDSAVDRHKTDPAPTQTGPTRSPWRPWAVTVLIGVVVLAVVVAIAVLTPHNSTPNPATAPSRTFAPATATTSPGPNQDNPDDKLPGFGLPTGDLFGTRLETPPDPAGIALPQDVSHRPDPQRPDYTTAAPAGMMWQRGWGGAALPFSTSDGPTTVTGGIASGFAHTPQGAGLAAYDALARSVAAPEGTWEQVVAQRYKGETGQQQTVLARYARSRAETAEAARYVIVPTGFRIDEYDPARPDFAVVRIAVPDRDGTAASTWPMVWVDGDWRVRIPSDGDDLWAQPQPVPAGVTYGTWR